MKRHFRDKGHCRIEEERVRDRQVQVFGKPKGDVDQDRRHGKQETEPGHEEDPPECDLCGGAADDATGP